MSATVLVVDDDRDVRETLKERLLLENYRVITCGTFIEAAPHLSPSFDGVVVTDLKMPGKTGLDLVERARQIDETLPVIVLTGFASTSAVVDLMREGAVTVLEKPCPLDRLLAQIAELATTRAAVLKTRKRRILDNMRSGAGRPPSESALAPQVREFEIQLIMKALKRNNGDKEKAAKELGLSRSSLYAKLRKMD